MEFKEMQSLHHRRSPPRAPRDFTGILIPPGHPLYEFYRKKHHHKYGVFPMFTIVFAWINAVLRADGTTLGPSDVGSSIVSQVNADGSTTVVATVAGNGNTATVAAPTTPGSYQYQVVNVDVNGVVGAAVQLASPVVIVAPVDSSPPVAPSAFTATLTQVPASSAPAAAAVKK